MPEKNEQSLLFSDNVKLEEQYHAFRAKHNLPDRGFYVLVFLEMNNLINVQSAKDFIAENCNNDKKLS